ncbi:MAG: hypothetical protein WCA21_06650, partial [Terracidiphilus sp.]
MRLQLVLSASALLLALPFFGCGGGSHTSSGLYMAGATTGATTGHGVATLWTNSTASYLSDGTMATDAYAVAVSGSDVYVAGVTVTATGRTVATLWTNGMATNLTDGTNDAQACAIAVSGSDVYVAGFTDSTTGKIQATLWKNGTASYLSDGTS